MPKLYPLENMDSMLPDNVHVDSVVASLLDCGSMAEENDPWDKKADSALKSFCWFSNFPKSWDVWSLHGPF